MKHLSALLLFAFVCTASAQTVKTLGYNTTNGHVVYSGTNALTFTNAPAFTDAATVRTNLGLGATAQTIFKVMTNDLSITNETNATTITDLTFDTAANARYAVTFVPTLEAAATSTVLTVVATNATVYGNWVGLSGSSVTAGTNAMTQENGFGVTVARSIPQSFYVLAGTNAGSIGITIRSSIATNTNTIKAGSFIRADLMPQ